MLRQENLRIYSWYSLPELKHSQKRSICIPLLNVPEIRHFLANFSKMVTMETITVTKISTSVLAMYFQIL